jgi:hypothetical protein
VYSSTLRQSTVRRWMCDPNGELLDYLGNL